MSLFKLGAVLLTTGVSQLLNRDPDAMQTVLDCIEKHSGGDWGDLCEDDKRLNDDALEAERKGEATDRIFSAYETAVGKLYVITEWDRTATTVLLPEEY